MTLAFTVGLVLPLVLIWLAMMLSPLLTRREIFFSVTVPPTFRESLAAKAILRGYWLRLSLLFAGLLALGSLGSQHPGATRRLLWPLLYVVGTLPAFFWARRRALPHADAPSMVREAPLSVTREAALEGLGWELPPFLVLAAAGAYLVGHWSDLPLRFPIHWGVDGAPNGWANRTVGGVLALLFIDSFVLAVLTSVRAMMFVARRARTMDPELRRHVSRVLLGFEWLTSVTMSRLALNPLWPAPVIALSLVMAVASIGLTLTVLVVVVRARLASGPVRSDGTDESRWKGGIFYVNRDDAALFVEKRFGFGWTLNFGRPTAWVIMIVLLLVPVVVGLVVTANR